MDFAERMTQKMGPFPVWVWGLFIGGAFVIWYWVSQRDAGQSALADSVEETGTVAPPSGDFGTVPVMPPSDGEVDDHTNLEWSAQAVIAATGTGTSLIAAQAAISKYLNSEKLSASETAIMNMILKKIGPPPEGVYVPTPTPETPKPTPEVETKDTVTSLDVPSSRAFNQAATIKVSVRWRNKGKRILNPSGRVVITIDGKKSAELPLVNGNAIYVAMPKHGWDSTKDKRWIVGARYVPGNGNLSSADPRVIVLTTT